MLKSCLCAVRMYFNATSETDCDSEKKQRKGKNMPPNRKRKTKQNGRKKHNRDNKRKEPLKFTHSKSKNVDPNQTTLTDFLTKRQRVRQKVNDAPSHEDNASSSSSAKKLEDTSSSKRGAAPSDGASSYSGRDTQPKRQHPNGHNREVFSHDVSDSESESSEETQPYTLEMKQNTSVHQVTTPHKVRASRNPSPRRKRMPFTPSPWSARDTEAYRNGYPGKKDNLSVNDNWKFYNNEIESKPRGDFIDIIHRDWYSNYNLLEDHHGYIQWLFPIREQGMNWQSKELQPHEAKKICGDPKAKERVLKSYEMMLNFWGMRLVDRRTGAVTRGANWLERFRHLNRSSHNYLRITRMLKSLGELGNERLKLPFFKFVLDEAILTTTLENAERSCLNYWIHTLRDEKQRREILDHANGLLAGT